MEDDKVISQIGSATSIIVGLTLLDKILALLKEILFAYGFGVSQELDIFNVSYAFPGIICLLFIQASDSAFVPIYLRHKNNKSLSRDFALSSFYLCTAVTGVLAVILSTFAYLIFPLLGYGFPGNAQALGIYIGRCLVFLVLIEGTGAILSAVLHAEKKFFELYISPLFINLCIIVSIYFFSSLGIWSLVWGMLAGSLLKALYMLHVLIRLGFKPFSKFSFDFVGIKIFLLQISPLIGSAMIVNSNILIDQVMSTELPSGSVSSLRYAYRINELPVQVLVIAISKAIFPFISVLAIENDWEGLRAVFKRGLQFICLVSLPVTCFVMVYAEELISLILGRGAFDQHAVKETSAILVYYSVGMIFYAYTFLNGVFFSALQKNKILLYMGILATLLNVFFNRIFMNIMHDAKGIALSTSVNSFVISLIFMILLNREIQINKVIIKSKEILYILVFSAICFVVLTLFKSFCLEKLYPSIAYLPLAILFYALLWVMFVRLIPGNDLKYALAMMIPGKFKYIVGLKS